MRRIVRVLGCGVLTVALAFTLAAPAVLAAETPAVGGYATGGPTITDETVPSADAQTPQASRLPFTGLQIAIMVVVGLCLVGLGIGLRQTRGTTSAAPG